MMCSSSTHAAFRLATEVRFSHFPSQKFQLEHTPDVRFPTRKVGKLAFKDGCPEYKRQTKRWPRGKNRLRPAFCASSSTALFERGRISACFPRGCLYSNNASVEVAILCSDAVTGTLKGRP